MKLVEGVVVLLMFLFVVVLMVTVVAMVEDMLGKVWIRCKSSGLLKVMKLTISLVCTVWRVRRMQIGPEKRLGPAATPS